MYCYSTLHQLIHNPVRGLKQHFSWRYIRTLPFFFLFFLLLEKPVDFRKKSNGIMFKLPFKTFVFWLTIGCGVTDSPLCSYLQLQVKRPTSFNLINNSLLFSFYLSTSFDRICQNKYQVSQRSAAQVWRVVQYLLILDNLHQKIRIALKPCYCAE